MEFMILGMVKRNRQNTTYHLPARVGYDPERCRSLTDAELARQLRDIHSRLLLRGRLETLLARREIGGLLTEYARRYPRERAALTQFAVRTVGLSYDEARRHMQLWVHWPRCLATLERLETEAKKAGMPLVIPGLRRLLALAGVVGKRGAAGIVPFDSKWDPVPEPLPNDVTELRRLVRRLQSVERDLRGRIASLYEERKYDRQRIGLLQRDAADLRRQIRQMPNC
jgi:hypothetical protein